MTAQDLIDLLEGIEADTEVRLAQQPSWPFEYSIGRVVCVQTGGPEVGEVVTYEDDEGRESTGTVKETMRDAVVVEEENGGVRVVPFHQLIGYLEPRDILYIGEGTQLAYLPDVVCRELGWR